MPTGARGRKKQKFKWAPMLKGDSGTAVTARRTESVAMPEAALGLGGAQVRPARQAATPKKSTAPASPTTTRVVVRGTSAAPGANRVLTWVLIACGAVGGLGACLLLASSLASGSGHHVEGTVMFLQRPLPEAMLCFHAGDSSVPCASAVTGRDGRFSVDMPSGSYKVTVRSLGDSDQGIPLTYGKVESTRFNLSVNGNVSAATMFIESK